MRDAAEEQKTINEVLTAQNPLPEDLIIGLKAMQNTGVAVGKGYGPTLRSKNWSLVMINGHWFWTKREENRVRTIMALGQFTIK